MDDPAFAPIFPQIALNSGLTTKNALDTGLLG
jgi:hypothetical protein